MPGWDTSWGTLHSEIREVGNITIVKLLLYYSLPKEKYIKYILYSYLPVYQLPTSISFASSPTIPSSAISAHGLQSGFL